MSILLYEVGRLLVDWWYPPDFQTSIIWRIRSLSPSSESELSSTSDQPPQPKMRGPEYTYWWYTGKGRRAIDRAFFGSVVEFWMNKARQLGHTWVPYKLKRGRLEDIRGIGFHLPKADTILSASPCSDGRCHLVSNRFFISRRANGWRNPRGISIPQRKQAIAPLRSEHPTTPSRNAPAEIYCWQPQSDLRVQTRRPSMGLLGRQLLLPSLVDAQKSSGVLNVEWNTQ